MTGPPLRAALIVSGPTLPKWAAEAVRQAVAAGDLQVVAVLDCMNHRTRKQVLKHFGYYLIRATLMRPRATRSVPLRDVVPHDVTTIRFEAEWDGNWQRIPAPVLRAAEALQLDVALKFGMGLLRDPQLFPARHGILSYHHGDPSSYRGRPVGFHELLHGAPHIGAVVQRLSNRLDGGEFLAAGKFRIEPHSYRKSLESVYSGSSLLLLKALRTIDQPPAPQGPLGPVYRLPSNMQVVQLLQGLLSHTLRRLAYGALYSKRWQLFECAGDALGRGGSQQLHGRPLPLPPGTAFLADPFYADASGAEVICERMPRHRMTGELVKINIATNAMSPVAAGNGRHFSYPYVLHAREGNFIVPEVAGWSAPLLLRMGEGTDTVALKGLEGERVLDPTLLEHDGMFWLFGTPSAPYRKLDALHLWFARELTGPYTPHPLNPVVLDPSSARPAGRIVERKGRLYRAGQDNTAEYGGGIAIREITELSVTTYNEEQFSLIKLAGFNGPHNIDFAKSKIIADGYQNAFDPLAGVKRILQLLNRA